MPTRHTQRYARRTRTVGITTIGLAAALTLSACSGADTQAASDAASNAVQQGGAAVTSAGRAAGEAGAAASSAAGQAGAAASSAAQQAGAAASSAAQQVRERVDLSSASTDEIAQTLKDNGVTDADRWAAEIDKLRDTSPQQVGAKLQQELASRGVDAQTAQRILDSIQP